MSAKTQCNLLDTTTLTTGYVIYISRLKRRITGYQISVTTIPIWESSIRQILKILR
jgi:hypothetical protein